MQEVQSPVSREALQEWVEDRYGVYMDVLSENDKTRMIYNETLFPEISVLFIGDAEKFKDTVEICGMYDHKTGEFRFISDRLASIMNGVSEMERWTGSHTSEDVYARISSYAKNAIEMNGYQFRNKMDEQFTEIQQAAQSALSAMTEYAAVLAARGEKDAVQEVRDLAEEMLHFWRDGVYTTYEKGYEKVERQYLEGFDQAVSAAMESGQAPAFDRDKAYSILRGLSIHAEEVTQNEDALSVWECCRLAKRVAADCPDQSAVFSGDFTADYSERFTRFGSQDWEHLQEGWISGRPVLLFNHAISEDCVPEGWSSYHLAGRNLRYADTLQKTVPEKDYAGTVLSPHALIPDGQQSCEIKDAFISMSVGYCSLEEFCQWHHLPEPDMSGIFSQQHTEVSAELVKSVLAEITENVLADLAEFEKDRKEKMGMTMGGM